MVAGGIAVSGALLCVASSDAHGRLTIVDLEESRTLSTWTVRAAQADGFTDAADVTIDGSHHLFVADARNDVVRRYSLFGREAGVVGAAPERGVGSVSRDRPGYLDAPRGVLVDGFRVWVAGGGRSRRGVQWFSTEEGHRLGGWLCAFGDVEAEFGAPRGLAVRGIELLVADTLHGHVQRFNRRDGRFIGSFRTAVESDEASRPCALLPVQGGDAVLVADQGDVQGLRLFGIDGRWRRDWQASPEFDRPVALAADGAGFTYVLDRDARRVMRMDENLEVDRLVVDLDEVTT